MEKNDTNEDDNSPTLGDPLLPSVQRWLGQIRLCWRELLPDRANAGRRVGSQEPGYNIVPQQAYWLAPTRDLSIFVLLDIWWPANAVNWGERGPGYIYIQSSTEALIMNFPGGLNQFYIIGRISVDI